ncbi:MULTISPECIES: branched-chain amino acid ABC transporter substrate-binding protein [Brevibacillus]|jgi:ABC-type branched-chain amino acid transport systems, periplasmic component|uniref:Branched chain amino acid ABC transporter substrate-binding protein n=1 Tax=Brevibacillus parabrevis TaxID=54914 RepID=A0A4Y3PNZ5_BREPA|nr:MULTISPECIES: branched-chain amino acid ABC transporter substrate-binding protein [Brevibacillus]RNB93410.1 branched-chain amino acid ABC transporter substrate-binding protein [Brevibacillus parabrevis]GEB34605.1 branched chain amino acid ABC transporter substrate-binding protein [Brevibacillus parabrevis]HBZ79355.1 branched-chain amino acid ABC transporter substrate-binding protein [Brevibacillus sp.]
MKKWGSVVVAALLSLSLAVAGCANQGQGAADANEILVGVLLPVTGNNATDGKDMQNAIEMAVKKVNDSGGVLGKKLKIEVADDGCDPQMATTAANKLVSQNVVAVVGGYCSGATLPSSGVFKNANIPMIVPAANSAKLPAQGYDTLFLINGLTPDQAQTAADYMAANQAKKVALIHDNSAYAKDLADFAKAAVEKSGGTVIAYEAINPEEKDFSALVTKLKGLQPDATYFTGYYAAGGLLVKQFKQKAVPGLFLVGDGSFSEDVIKIAGADNAEGLLITATPTAEFIEGAEAFTTEYKQTYNNLAPGPFSALSYNAVNLLADALKRANSTERDAIKKALKETKDFQALGQTISFNAQNTLDTSNFAVLKVTGGKFILAK